MKKIALFVFITSFASFLQAQDSTLVDDMHSTLTSWDPVRGKWLHASLMAISNNQIVPDRTFPEEFTPYEMLTMVPMETRRTLQERISVANGRNGNAQSNRLDMIFRHSFCQSVMGRSFGDPHIGSFDNASYSFQTVGEFVLSKSSIGHFEVQARQRQQGESFSLNTAVAMNVGGDRLCFYANEKPDFDRNPFRLNGQPVQLMGRTYFLPHGGTLRLEGKNYIVSWPSGEQVIMDRSANATTGFTNLTVRIFPCDNGIFEGVLGNANGSQSDDFNGRGGAVLSQSVFAGNFGNGASTASSMAEQEYYNFLTKDFAEDWRVTDQNTLFDYAPGESTFTFTDRSFPRVHYTLNNLSAAQQAAGRRRCEQMGVSLNEMNGCIYDHGFLNIQPNPIPTPTVPTQGVVLKKIEHPSVQNNLQEFMQNGGGAHPQPIVKPNVNAGETNTDNPVHHPTINPNTQPIDKPETSPVSKPHIQINAPSHNVPVNSNPVTPKPTITPNVGKAVKIGKG